MATATVTAVALTASMRAAPATAARRKPEQAPYEGWPAPAQAEVASSSLTVTNLYPVSVMDATSLSSCSIRLAFGSDPPS
jgi:hypothetical protein